VARREARVKLDHQERKDAKEIVARRVTKVFQ
jgi:hypothetical protein